MRWGWSPAGNERSEAFYPGDDVVDYIGLTILGDEGWDQAFGLAPQSFADLLRPKYARVAPLGKPIVIAEVGVSGTPGRQREWLVTAARALSDFPLVRAMSYFNAVNVPNKWLPTEPDWRATPDAVAALIEPPGDLTPVAPSVKLADQPAPTSTSTAEESAPTSSSPGPTLPVRKVGNTGGLGVYLRRTPRLNDRSHAWKENARMILLGEEAEAEGLHWLKVRDPAGNEGWVPQKYLVQP